tara:strand:- start:1467 stop:1796 length:330 start_codon:yes stop_codon:yes gene_type:complete
MDSSMASLESKNGKSGNSLGHALKTVRSARGLSQEAFSNVSSRTYLSSLERGLKNPTLIKVNEICRVLEVHPLTILALAYADGDVAEVDKLLEQVRQELNAVLRRPKVS